MGYLADFDLPAAAKKASPKQSSSRVEEDTPLILRAVAEGVWLEVAA